MQFAIITPSFNQLDYLKRCVASVRDQVTDGIAHGAERIVVCHHIQDGGSTDGTVEWLRKIVDATPSSRDYESDEGVASTFSYQLTFASEADEGMYDAINKGIQHALGGIRQEALGFRNPSNQHSTTINSRDSVVAWLNCDEQYLPGSLQKVAEVFAAHPKVDIVFGGMLMVDAEGELLSCRKAMPMRYLFLEASYLYNYSCAMFFRRSVWEKLGGFDVTYRNAGDEEWVRRAVRSGTRSAVLGDYLAAFAYAGQNLSSDAESALREHDALKRSSSRAVRVFRLPINMMRLAEKWLRGGIKQRGPLAYAIYSERIDARTRFDASNPDCRWPDESMPYLVSHRLK